MAKTVDCRSQTVEYRKQEIKKDKKKTAKTVDCRSQIKEYRKQKTKKGK